MIPKFCMDPVLFAMHLLGFNPDPTQRQVLNPAIWRGILNCCRQWGKSTVMAIKALHQALILAPGTTVLVLCPTKHQAGEFFEALRAFMRTLNVAVHPDGHNKPSVRLPNDSRIIGISSRSNIRSYRRVSLLLVDEAAEVREEAYQVIRPTLATTGDFGGKIWMMSTPQGDRGMFFRTWSEGGPRWSRFSVTAEQCPRISKQFLAEEREYLGDRLYRQEYMCEFISPPDCLLNREDIYAAVRPDVPGIWHDLVSR